MRTILSIAFLNLVVLTGCAASPDEASATDSANLTATEPPDCRTACPGLTVGGLVLGDFSDQRRAEVSFYQRPDCQTLMPTPSEEFHTARAGEPCALETRDGRPDGAFACETFACGETGTFTASACVGRAWNGPGTDTRKTCADRTVACALALEANAQMRERRTMEPEKKLCK